MLFFKSFATRFLDLGSVCSFRQSRGLGVFLLVSVLKFVDGSIFC